MVKNEELRDKIIELICDNNFIKKIPPEISGCEQMVRINVKGNLLKKVPPGVCKLKLLEELDISDNQLKVRYNSISVTFTFGHSVAVFDGEFLMKAWELVF